MIFKYKFFHDDYYGKGVYLGNFFGCIPYLYDWERENYTLYANGVISQRRKGFGNDWYYAHEVAFEIKPGQFKTWMDGKLMDRFESDALKVTNPYIYFGGGMRFFLNDVFCINKSEFLPDKYTVNWREPWYELIPKPIYTHYNEAFYSK